MCGSSEAAVQAWTAADLDALQQRLNAERQRRRCCCYVLATLSLCGFHLSSVCINGISCARVGWAIEGHITPPTCGRHRHGPLLLCSYCKAWSPVVKHVIGLSNSSLKNINSNGSTKQLGETGFGPDTPCACAKNMSSIAAAAVVVVLGSFSSSLSLSLSVNSNG